MQISWFMTKINHTECNETKYIALRRSFHIFPHKCRKICYKICRICPAEKGERIRLVTKVFYRQLKQRKLIYNIYGTYIQHMNESRKQRGINCQITFTFTA